MPQHAFDFSDEEDTKEVIDVVEKPLPPIARPRVATADLTMQVFHKGAYHRRTPDLATTACGQRLHSEYSPVRREVLLHPLSRDCGCFTPFELAKADEAEAKRFEP